MNLDDQDQTRRISNLNDSDSSILSAVPLISENHAPLHVETYRSAPGWNLLLLNQENVPVFQRHDELVCFFLMPGVDYCWFWLELLVGIKIGRAHV